MYEIIIACPPGICKGSFAQELYGAFCADCTRKTSWKMPLEASRPAVTQSGVAQKYAGKAVLYRLFHLNERKAIWHSIKQECSWFMGNLGFMKSKPLVCRAFAENRRKSLYPSPLFYGFPRPQLYPHGKRRCSAPDAPAQQAEADLARIKEVRSCRKSNGISKRSNESGWLFSGRCVSDTPSCLGGNPGRAT